METLSHYVEAYGPYLEDIRSRIYGTAIFFALVFAGGFFSTNSLLRLLTGMLHITGVEIVTTSPFQLIDVAMDVGFFCAVLFTSPLVLYHTYRFLRPGLLPFERRIFFALLPLMVLLFLMGFSYGFAIMYYALHIIAAVNVGVGVVNLWDISLFMSQIIMTATLLGLLFEVPIIVSFLIRVGIVSVDFLRAKRRHAMVFIFIFVSLLPPTDGLSLLLMSAPLVAIYELTILFNAKKSPRASFHLIV